MAKRKRPRPKKPSEKKVKPKKAGSRKHPVVKRPTAAERKRSAAAKRGWETRAARAAEDAARTERRRKAGQKAWRTRQARLAVTLELRHRLKLDADGASSPRWQDSDGPWYDAKDELLDALGDYERYMAVLEDIADDEGTDWQIAYSGAGGIENA